MEQFNLQRLDLASIRLVVLCAECGSLSEAARRSHLSISGASHRLKAFEDALGFEVFLRHRRGLRLTDRGAHAVYCSTQLLSWVDNLRTGLACDVPTASRPSRPGGFAGTSVAGVRADAPSLRHARMDAASVGIRRHAIAKPLVG